MAKKIIKKAKTTVTNETAVKKTAPKATKIKKELANITNCDDLFCVIRDKYNEVNDTTTTKEEVSKIWKAFQSALAEFSEKSESEKATVLLPDIGVLTVFVAPERESINPRTREKITVPAKKRVRFRAYPRFVNQINGITKE